MSKLEHTFSNFQPSRALSTYLGIYIRARICQRLNSPGIDSTSLCSLAAGTTNRVSIPARQVKLAGGIDSLESIPGLLKSLNFWALVGQVDECRRQDYEPEPFPGFLSLYSFM